MADLSKLPEITYVTRPSLPPLEEFVSSLEEIWRTRKLTNAGPFHEEFEARLAEYLGVKHVSLFCNGMLALQIGLQALKISGEVITTPYSFVATTHAIYWNRCTPVFCDIDPVTLTLDPEKIESLITPQTTAIMPVHVYGTPCNCQRLQEIADLYGLKLFYDAAHAFGVQQHGSSILNHGDLSMLSFHATKTFNTFEGGALITNDPKLKKRIDFLKNFGFADEVTVVAPGTNGKMNEVQSAMGLLQLKYFENNIKARKEITGMYLDGLDGVPGISCLAELPDVKRNYSYFPIFVDEEQYGMSRDSLFERMKAHNIYARRYFHPLISHFPSYRDLPSACSWMLPVAEKAAKQVICLPLFEGLDKNILEFCVELIRNKDSNP